MGVYIKGMEMPKSCYECWALNDDGDYPRCRITEEQRGYNFDTRGRKMSKCPLTEVPEPHGRLIDADACIDYIRNNINQQVWEALAYEPTVIEESNDVVIDAPPSTNKPTGEWIDKGEYAECSICEAHSVRQFDGVELIPLKTNFCSNCGARLIGGDSK